MHPLRLALAALSLSATASFAQPPVADRGDRMLRLTVVIPVSDEQAETLSALLCTAERDFCLRAWRATDTARWTLDMHDRPPTNANLTPARRIELPAGEDPEGETHGIWPHLIREASGALMIGIERYRRAGFSGGGAGETNLVLFRLTSGTAEPTEVLTVQTGYGAMIRACFTEQDYRSRGACHDEYELSGTLSLAPGAAGAHPRLALATTARSFPRGARSDSDETRRLRRSDLVWEADPGCSYRRTFTFNPASGRYEPDRPLPECSTYQLP